MLAKRTPRAALGITLAEILIAITISAAVIAGLLGLFFLTTKHSRSSLNIARLDSQLHLVLSSMTNDIRRAGYWANAGTSSTNPFMVTGSTDISVSGGNCILMTYDQDSNGALPGISASIDDERYGYRLRNSAIQYRPAGAQFNCAAPINNWTNLTDPNVVQITAFSVSINVESSDLDGPGPGTETLQVRTVTITITGQLTSDPSINKTLTKTVRVYNDKYVP